MLKHISLHWSEMKFKNLRTLLPSSNEENKGKYLEFKYSNIVWLQTCLCRRLNITCFRSK